MLKYEPGHKAQRGKYTFEVKAGTGQDIRKI